jgi:glycosyltransferase involved in cell wall biosynthesis
MDRSVDVAILKSLASEASISMDRYALELEEGLAEFSPFTISTHALHEADYWATNKAIGKLSRYDRRYRQYPRSIREIHARIYHIADQAYSHLLDAIPSSHCVITCHDLNLLTQRAWGSTFHFKPRHLLFRWSIQRMRDAAHVIAVSKATRSDILRFELAAPDRISVIPPGLSPAFYPRGQSNRKPFRESIFLADGDFAILHVGEDGVYKNFENVLKTTAELNKRGVSAKLVRVGKPITFWSNRLIEDLKLRPLIRDLGRVDDDTLALAYTSADCLLFPSLREGFGWPVVEAMACGLPVITSRDSALLELSEGAGFHADAADIQGLADLVENLSLDGALRSEVSIQGLAKARRFSRESTAVSITKVYEHVMEN